MFIYVCVIIVYGHELTEAGLSKFYLHILYWATEMHEAVVQWPKLLLFKHSIVICPAF